MHKELAISDIRRENKLSFINDEFRLINAFSMPITRLLRCSTFISFEKRIYINIIHILIIYYKYYQCYLLLN